MPKTFLDVGAANDIGKVRKVNQDKILAVKFTEKNKTYGMFAVADGLGGMTDGEVGSAIIIDRLLEWWSVNFFMLTHKDYENNVKEYLHSVILQANDEIKVYSAKIGNKVCTTLSLILIAGDRYYFFHAGDSRIYMLKGRNVSLLTKDHTWVSEQVSKNLIPESEANNHPKRNVLVNCLGIDADLYIDMSSGRLKSNDIVFLCSDGFYGFISIDDVRESLAAAVGSKVNMQQKADELLGLVKEGEAKDNISVIAVRYTSTLLL